MPGLRRLLSGLDLALAFLAISESWGDADAHPEALACASEGILLAVSHGDPELAARLRTSLARNLFSQGLYEAMDAVQQAALADAVASGSARAEALIRNNLAFTLPSLGRIDEALEQGARALTLARQAGDTELEGLVAGNHGGRLAERGRVAEARPFVERALALARAGGEPGRESWALQMLFELQRSSGELEAALLTARRAAALGLDAGDPHKQVRGLTRLGAVLVELGRAAEALEVLDRALAVIGRHEAHSASGAEVLALRAVACLATGGARAVGPDLDRAEALARRTRRTVELARVLLVRATLAAWAGQPSRAREWLSHAAAECDGAQLRLAPKRALVEGGLAEVADDLDAARRAYVGAAERCREASWAPGRLLLLPAWGRAEAALGRSEAARTLWAEAVGAGRGMGLLGVAAVAEAHLAALDGDPAAARLALERDLPRLSVRERYEARYVLARALGDAVLAAQADDGARLLQAEGPPWAAGAARGRRC